MAATFSDLARLGYRLKESFPIRLPDGTVWSGSLWATPSRKSGRRIQVRDDRGNPLFDTDDCFDFANAQNSLDCWLSAKIA